MRVVIALAMGVLVAGCATTYQPQGATGGYSESFRGDDVYLVRFEGNGYTKRDQVEDMAMLRAAELTLQKGHRYFAILREDTRVDSSTYTAPSQAHTRGRIDSFGNYRATTTYSGGGTYDISAPTARLLVAMANSKEQPGRVWIDAQRIIDELGPKYRK